MTIPFGRRRLILSLSVVPAPPRGWAGVDLTGATDAELAHLNARKPGDIDRARWETMTLMYGGMRPR